MPREDTQWKPGQSGNPKGRARRPTFEELVYQVLDERVPGEDLTKREQLARSFVKMLLNADSKMLREFMDRAWPKTTKHEVSGAEGQPLDFVALAQRARETEERAEETLQ